MLLIAEQPSGSSASKVVRLTPDGTIRWQVGPPAWLSATVDGMPDGWLGGSISADGDLVLFSVSSWRVLIDPTDGSRIEAVFVK